MTYPSRLAPIRNGKTPIGTSPAPCGEVLPKRGSKCTPTNARPARLRLRQDPNLTQSKRKSKRNVRVLYAIAYRLYAVYKRSICIAHMQYAYAKGLSQEESLGELAILVTHVHLDESSLRIGLPHVLFIGRVGLEIDHAARRCTDKSPLARGEEIRQGLPRIRGIRVLGNASVRDEIRCDIVQNRDRLIKPCRHMDRLIRRILNPDFIRCPRRIEHLRRSDQGNR